ncbi:11972_t:CDS:1, partial [Gigaspora rosea]
RNTIQRISNVHISPLQRHHNHAQYISHSFHGQYHMSTTWVASNKTEMESILKTATSF